ncbi:class II aaRS and biotin synthetase [Jackrogersella minutella]|nr:class II aaRS and biotin synthetase [Jackrogersella minutella]
MPELNNVRERWPSKDLVWLDETPVIPFSKGIQMLRDDGREVGEEDLSTRDEIRLGEIAKETYQPDYYILDKFPANARPFYTHKAEEPKRTNSFYIFLRGREICTGEQRIHVAKELRASMAESKTSEQEMEEYLSAFDLGAPPHGGAGLGLERIVMLLLKLNDERNASLFPRDPKSLPARPPVLPHPDADTLAPRNPKDEYLPIENLIGNHGDATNTSWLDDRFEIWRHPTGAAEGFVRQAGKFAMIAGDPLCDTRQYREVTTSVVEFVQRDLRRTPVWMLVTEEVQQVLAEKMGWRTLSCAEEQRVNADQRRREPRPATSRGAPGHAGAPRGDAARAHRRYFAAEKDKSVLGLVVLARLAPRHGWQVKWALDFPRALNGTVEAALAAVPPGQLATFGVGVSERLAPRAQLRGAKFREKFGVLGEMVFICCPRHGLGGLDLQQVVRFFED